MFPEMNNTYPYSNGMNNMNMYQNPMQNQGTPFMYPAGTMPNMQMMPQNQEMNPEMMEKMYPDIYKMIYPMVRKEIGMNGNMPITEEMIDRMTNSIYMSMEADDKIGGETEARTSGTKTEVAETRQRRPNNFILKDLIRILLLREVLGNNMRPPRPPHHHNNRVQYNPYMRSNETWY